MLMAKDRLVAQFRPYSWTESNNSSRHPGSLTKEVENFIRGDLITRNVVGRSRKTDILLADIWKWKYKNNWPNNWGRSTTNKKNRQTFFSVLYKTIAQSLDKITIMFLLHLFDMSNASCEWGDKWWFLTLTAGGSSILHWKKWQYSNFRSLNCHINESILLHSPECSTVVTGISRDRIFQDSWLACLLTDLSFWSLHNLIYTYTSIFLKALTMIIIAFTLLC